MRNFINLSKKDKLNIFNQTSVRSGLPPSAIEKDYRTMQESMFYGSTIRFNTLMERIKKLNTKINGLAN